MPLFPKKVKVWGADYVHTRRPVGRPPTDHQDGSLTYSKTGVWIGKKHYTHINDWVPPKPAWVDKVKK